jgi:hypothetical protein
MKRMFYLLTPRRLDAAEWELSTFREPSQIEATSEDNTRIRAGMHFGIATKIEPGKPTRFNTWGSRELVTAQLIPSPDPTVLMLLMKDERRRSGKRGPGTSRSPSRASARALARRTGELIMLDENGKPKFHQLRGRCAIKDPERLGRAAVSKPAAVFAFDLLQLRGKDLRALPY